MHLNHPKSPPALVAAICLAFALPSHQAGACTGFIIAGAPFSGGTMLCKVRDSRSWREGVSLVIDDEGYKRIVIQTADAVATYGHGGSALSGINEKGVGGATFAGSSDHSAPSGLAPSEVCGLALMHASTAEEYVAGFGELVTDRGVKAPRGGGISGAVDPREGWRIEYTGTFYAIEEGPIADSRSVVANLFLLPSMVEHCTSPPSRPPRQSKAEALVEEGLRLAPWDLAKTFAFSRNEEMPESPGRAICYSSSPEGEYETGTVSGHVMIPDAEHTDLLSVLWWSPEMPVLAPYIPLFIGVTEIPDAICSLSDFEMADTFARLRRLAFPDPEAKAETLRTWEEFEARQQAKVESLVAEVRTLADRGERKEAESLLDAFLREQVETVLSEANRLIGEFSSQGK